MAVTISATQQETSYSVANNNSQVRVVVKAITSGESFNNNEITSTITVDGTAYTVKHKLPKKSTTVIFDKTLTIAHASNGSKSVTTKYIVPTAISAGTLEGNATPNPLVLTNTPRQSVLGGVTISIANNGTTTVKPTITKYVSSYYDTLIMQSGSNKIEIGGVTNGTSVTLNSTQLATLWKAFGNLTSVTFSCTLQTKTASSGTVIGTSSAKTVTANLPNYTLNGTYGIVDTIANYDSFKKDTSTNLILNLSKPKITWTTVSTTGSTYGNTITSKMNGTTATSPQIIDNFVNTNYTIVSTDGRYTSTFSPFSSYKVIAYQKPSVVTCSLVRTSPTSSEATATVKVKYYDGTNLQNLKSLAFIFTYTQSGASAVSKALSTFTKGTPSTTSNMTTVSYTLKITGLDYKKAITYGVSGTDLLGIAFSKTNLVLPQGMPLWHGFNHNNSMYMRIHGKLRIQDDFAFPNVSGGNSGVTGVKTASSVIDSGWTTTAQRTWIPNMSFMAYWNGAYNGSASNLNYCASGTIIGSNGGTVKHLYFSEEPAYNSMGVRPLHEYSASASSVSVATGTQKNLCSVTVTQGYYVGVARVWMTSNASGYRALGITNSSGTAFNSSNRWVSYTASSADVGQSMIMPFVMAANSGGDTFKLWGYQTSGSNLNMSAYVTVYRLK